MFDLFQLLCEASVVLFELHILALEAVCLLFDLFVGLFQAIDGDFVLNRHGIWQLCGICVRSSCPRLIRLSRWLYSLHYLRMQIRSNLEIVYQLLSRANFPDAYHGMTVLVTLALSPCCGWCLICPDSSDGCCAANDLA